MLPLIAGALLGAIVSKKQSDNGAGLNMAELMKLTGRKRANTKAIAGAKVDELLQNGNVKAFLRVIRYGETSADNDRAAYQMLNGGGSFAAPPWRHPGGSKAAGAYQFMVATWADVSSDMGGLADFSPLNQDRAAVGLIACLGGLPALLAGDTHAAYAILSVNAGWPSLPGGQQCAVYAKMINKADGSRLAPEAAADFIFAKWGGHATGK